MMANEKRLIDANALMAYIHNHDYQLVSRMGCVDKGMFTDGIEHGVNIQPTVDAVEAVHGRWEDAYGGKYANPRYRCSACKEGALIKWERDVLGSFRGVQALTPYCPYCMAKLDGGKGNDV